MVRARGLPRLLLLAACLLCASARASASATTADYVRWVRVDYYGALNVTSRANATEIKSKYRRLALQFHPDKLGHLGARERKVAEDSCSIPPSPSATESRCAPAKVYACFSARQLAHT